MTNLLVDPLSENYVSLGLVFAPDGPLDMSTARGMRPANFSCQLGRVIELPTCSSLTAAAIRWISELLSNVPRAAAIAALEEEFDVHVYNLGELSFVALAPERPLLGYNVLRSDPSWDELCRQVRDTKVAGIYSERSELVAMAQDCALSLEPLGQIRTTVADTVDEPVLIELLGLEAEDL